MGDRTYLTGGRKFDNLADEAAFRGSKAPDDVKWRIERDVTNNDLNNRGRFNLDHYKDLLREKQPKRWRQRHMSNDEKLADDLAQLNKKTERREQKRIQKEQDKIKKEENKEIKKLEKDQKDYEVGIAKQKKLDEKQAKLDKKYGNTRDP